MGARGQMWGAPSLGNTSVTNSGRNFCREERSSEDQHYFSFCRLQLPERGGGSADLLTRSTASEPGKGREMPQ